MRIELPQDVTAAFVEIGRAQRGAPETAMGVVQEAAGGGVLFPVVEHVGDISHRITHMAPHGLFGAEYALEKADKGIRHLAQEYGFEREMAENMRSNAARRGVSLAEFERAVDAALAAYAAEHKKLPAYNRPQWLAREAAVAVGEKRWKDAVELLCDLRDMAADDAGFDAAAAAFERGRDGGLLRYEDTAEYRAGAKPAPDTLPLLRHLKDNGEMLSRGALSDAGFGRAVVDEARRRGEVIGSDSPLASVLLTVDGDAALEAAAGPGLARRTGPR